MKTARTASLLVIVIIGIIAILTAIQYTKLVAILPTIKDKDVIIAFSSQLQVYAAILSASVTGLIGILASTEKTPPLSGKADHHTPLT